MKLNVNGISFSYPSKSVLNDITFDFDGPQLVAILGPNGVGKSTLIKLINKIIFPAI